MDSQITILVSVVTLVYYGHWYFQRDPSTCQNKHILLLIFWVFSHGLENEEQILLGCGPYMWTFTNSSGIDHKYQFNFLPWSYEKGQQISILSWHLIFVYIFHSIFNAAQKQINKQISDKILYILFIIPYKC